MSLRFITLFLILPIMSFAMHVRPFRTSDPGTQRRWFNDTFTADWCFNNDDMRVTLYEKKQGCSGRGQLVGRLLLEGFASGQIAGIRRVNEDELSFDVQGAQFYINERVVTKDVTFSHTISGCPRW